MQLEPTVSNRSMLETRSSRTLHRALGLHCDAAPPARFVLRQLNNLQIALKISYKLLQPYVIFQTECQMSKPFGKKNSKTQIPGVSFQKQSIVPLEKR